MPKYTIYTPEQLKDMEQRRYELMLALTTGAKSVSHGDKTIVYKTQNEMKDAIALIDKEINGVKETRIIKIIAKRW